MTDRAPDLVRPGPRAGEALYGGLLFLGGLAALALALPGSAAAPQDWPLLLFFLLFGLFHDLDRLRTSGLRLRVVRPRGAGLEYPGARPGRCRVDQWAGLPHLPLAPAALRGTAAHGRTRGSDECRLDEPDGACVRFDVRRDRRSGTTRASRTAVVRRGRADAGRHAGHQRSGNDGTGADARTAGPRLAEPVRYRDRTDGGADCSPGRNRLEPDGDRGLPAAARRAGRRHAGAEAIRRDAAPARAAGPGTHRVATGEDVAAGAPRRAGHADWALQPPSRGRIPAARNCARPSRGAPDQRRAGRHRSLQADQRRPLTRHRRSRAGAG